MLLSGPAGGVTGAVWVAEQCGFSDLITFDMGGTSTDVALVQGLTPRIGRETKVGDLTVRASSVDVRTVGAGGGSIAHVPQLTRALRVGPQSAGADPGPAAYGRGGTEPTVTDANVVLGYLPPSLAGGEITLDVGAARTAVETVAEAMGLPSSGGRSGGHRRHRQREHARRAAAGVGAAGLRPARLRPGRVRRRRAAARQRARQADGRLAGDRAAVAGRALRVGRRDDVGAQRVGAHRAAPVRRTDHGEPGGDPGRARRRRRRPAGRPGRARGRAQIATYQVDVRYHGQGFEIPIDVEKLDLAALTAAFDAEHERLFSFLLTQDHELVNARATVTGPRPSVAPVTLPPTEGPPEPVDTHPDLSSRAPRSTPGLRPGHAARGRRDRRPGDRHGDGLDHSGAARPCGHRARVGQLAHPAGRRRTEPWQPIIETAAGIVDKPAVDPVTLDLIENALRNARYEMDEVLLPHRALPRHPRAARRVPADRRPEREDGGRPVRALDPRLPRGLRRDDRGGRRPAHLGPVRVRRRDQPRQRLAGRHADLSRGPGRGLGVDVRAHVRRRRQDARRSMPTDARTIYEEGVVIPPFKLYAQGRAQRRRAAHRAQPGPDAGLEPSRPQRPGRGLPHRRRGGSSRCANGSAPAPTSPRSTLCSSATTTR